MATTIHAGDCTSDCATCIYQCTCEKCAMFCNACGQYYSKAEMNIYKDHAPQDCPAQDEIGLLCNMCGDEMTDAENHSFFEPIGEICEECTNEINTIKENNK